MRLFQPRYGVCRCRRLYTSSILLEALVLSYRHSALSQKNLAVMSSKVHSCLQQATLTKLPVELLLNVANHLSFEDLARLKRIKRIITQRLRIESLHRSFVQVGDFYFRPLRRLLWTHGTRSARRHRHKRPCLRRMDILATREPMRGSSHDEKRSLPPSLILW